MNKNVIHSFISQFCLFSQYCTKKTSELWDNTSQFFFFFLIHYSMADIRFYTWDFFFFFFFSIAKLHHCALSTSRIQRTNPQPSWSRGLSSTGARVSAWTGRHQLAVPQGCQIHSNRLPSSNSQRADRVCVSHWENWLTTHTQKERESKCVFSKEANDSDENVH